MNQPLLFLNDVATSEVVFILLAVLMLFGAKSIPSLAKNLGRGMREIKTATDEIKSDITKSAMDMKRDMNMGDIDISLDQIKKPLDALKDPIKEIGKSIIEAPKSIDEYDSKSNKS
jgi:sec-independent protein translocase protein TatA